MCLYKTEYSLRISFEDLDPMNIVWHGNYMKYMEQARCDMLAKLNYTYMDMKKENVGYPVAKMKVKYIKPSTLNDVLTVVTSVEMIEPSLNLKYEIYKNNEKIFEATTMQIGINMVTGESVYTAPEGLKRAIEGIKNEKS